MSFGIKRDAKFVSANNELASNRPINKVEAITESVIRDFEVPEWATRNKRLVIKTDSRIFAFPEMRMHQATSPCLCWKAMDGFPITLHLHLSRYNDK